MLSFKSTLFAVLALIVCFAEFGLASSRRKKSVSSRRSSVSSRLTRKEQIVYPVDPELETDAYKTLEEKAPQEWKNAAYQYLGTYLFKSRKHRHMATKIGFGTLIAGAGVGIGVLTGGAAPALGLATGLGLGTAAGGAAGGIAGYVVNDLIKYTFRVSPTGKGVLVRLQKVNKILTNGTLELVAAPEYARLKRITDPKDGEVRFVFKNLRRGLFGRVCDRTVYYNKKRSQILKGKYGGRDLLIAFADGDIKAEVFTMGKNSFKEFFNTLNSNLVERGCITFNYHVPSYNFQKAAGVDFAEHAKQELAKQELAKQEH